MRLTLRTMLAYLDDILEPNDSQDIGKKIEESEFATTLVHRIRDSMRRLRLGVPSLSGRGLGGDPNTVAEYLDNTLSADRVPEFEKICLESDVHLAEVAGCHQILTLVLGEPVTIAQETRERMYRLSSQADAPPPLMAARGAASTGAPPPIHRATPRPRPEVPEYLREPKRRWWPLVAMAVLAAVLTGGGLWLFGPAELREKAVALVSPNDAANPPDVTLPDTIEPNSPEPPDSTALTPAPRAPAAEEPQVAEPQVEMNDPRVVDANPILPPGAADAATNEDPNAPPAPGPDDRGLAVDDRGLRDAATPVEGIGEPTAPPASEPADATVGTPIAPNPPLPDSIAGDTAPDESQEGFGLYTSSKPEVLLRYDAGLRDWARLAGSSPLSVGDRLLSLPSYQPLLTLGRGITIKTEGPAHLQLVGWTEAGAPVINVDYGRLWLATVGRANNSLVLSIGGVPTELTFVDPESMVAVDVRRVLPPGQDPSEGGTATADFYGKRGICRVRDIETTQELESGLRLTVAQGRFERNTGQIPDWVVNDTATITNADQQARTQLDAQLAIDRPAAATLAELVAQRERGIARRVEVRSLAVRSLAYLDVFEPLIESLADRTERNYWSREVEDLKAAVARSPETAAKVRTALENKRGVDAPVLYRMLWGYSNDDLRRGSDRDLVEALDHEAMDVRNLAYWNLHDITGQTFGYQATDAAKDRKAKIQRWQRQLDQKKIGPKTD